MHAVDGTFHTAEPVVVAMNISSPILQYCALVLCNAHKTLRFFGHILEKGNANLKRERCSAWLRFSAALGAAGSVFKAFENALCTNGRFGMDAGHESVGKVFTKSIGGGTDKSRESESGRAPQTAWARLVAGKGGGEGGREGSSAERSPTVLHSPKIQADWDSSCEGSEGLLKAGQDRLGANAALCTCHAMPGALGLAGQRRRHLSLPLPWVS
jgi:hypothetical protein